MYSYERQFLYRAWGLYHHKCIREQYKGNTIILHSKVHHIRMANARVYARVRRFPFFTFTSSPDEGKILMIKKLKVKIKRGLCSPGEG